MPLRRPTARRGRLRAAAASSSSSSPSPPPVDDVDKLIQFLASVPDSFPDGGEPARDGTEPPAKRVKVDDETPGFMTIGQHQLSFTVRSESPGSARICRRGVGKYFRFHLDRPNPSTNELWELRMQRNGTKSTFCLSRTLDLDDLPQGLCLMFRYVSQTRDDWGSIIEGYFDSSFDIDLVQTGNDVDIRLTIRLNWSEMRSERVRSKFYVHNGRAKRHKILDAYLPDMVRPPSWSPQYFYEACYVPPRDGLDQALQTAEVPGLTARLFPFQRRTIAWLLNREQVAWTLKPGTTDQSRVEPLGYRVQKADVTFTTAQDVFGQSFNVSPVFGPVIGDPSRYYPLQDIRGGVLAEEMGLGKTLEIIGLVLLHRRPECPPTVFDPFVQRQLRPTGATLIITPAALLDQWMAELATHAPQLKVAYYSGFKAFAEDDESGAETVERLANNDVVLTTYTVLRPEIHVAREPPARSLRGQRKYERPKSPLMELSWWRVCIDEAQMVENWTNNTATLARLVPRVNSWAVTGTPVKDDISKDFRGLLSFLRFEPYASDTGLWLILFKLNEKFLGKLVSHFCLRHTKGMVRNEIALPQQKRYVITMPFSAVEEQHYQTLFRELVSACGLDTQGNPVVENWSPDDGATQEAMRIALDRLRQTALHPGVGVHNRRALGHRQGPMRTVSEVLDAMMEQSDATLRSDQRGLLHTRLTRGQIAAGLGRVRDALAIWEDVAQTSATMVAECRDHLRKETEQARIRETSHGRSERDDDDDDGDSQEEATVPARVAEARRRLRYALEIQHQAVFFCANAHYTVKEDRDLTAPDSDEFRALEKKETECYDQAKLIRKEILHEMHSRVSKLMASLASAASTQAFAVIPELEPLGQKGGIESRKAVEAFEEVSAALDAQANQLDEWREHVIQLLLRPLLDEESDDLTGEEYEESTKLQDEITVYVQVLRTAVADRQDAISGQKNFLVDHEYKVALRQARAGEGAFPEKLIELMRERDAVRPRPDPDDALSSLRGVVAALRALSTKLRNEAATGSGRAGAEQAVVTRLLRVAQDRVTEQTKAAAAMEQEVERFTDTMNARLDFYRQLQAVSDMVADYAGEKTPESLAALERQEDNARRALAAAEAKHRYLVHLKEADSGGEEQRMCIICQSDFSVGVLTVCGHQFCKDCITLWFRAHRNCPVCKRHLDRTNLHDITLKPRELRIHTADGTGDASSSSSPSSSSPPSPSAKNARIYTEFSPEKLAEIKNMELDGPSFTTKVDTLVRHLLWLRGSDPGAKSIVFSQYKDFMDVLALAFRRHHIGYTSFDDGGGVAHFKDDPGVEVFLLHARAHSSGLNLVNASHVFLCEPLLNTALELQAIARVDRIGQQHETTVWLYIVDGTVEESIHRLSVRRRMEHMGDGRSGGRRDKSNEEEESTPELLDAKLEAANSLELEQAHLSKLMGKGSVSGEAVDKNDLWACLFGHQNRGAQQQQQQQRDDEQIQNNPAMRGLLAAQAAEDRRNEETRDEERNDG